MESKGSVSSPENGPMPQWNLSSSSGLHYGSLKNSLSSFTPKAAEKPAVSRRRAYITVAVLSYINLINYMERYTIAGEMISCVHMTTLLTSQQLCLWLTYIHCHCHTGVLPSIQKFFVISDSMAALLQTGMTMHRLDGEIV